MPLLIIHASTIWGEPHIAVTIPWAAEWLAHYELWKQSGQWHGNADPPEGGALINVARAEEPSAGDAQPNTTRA